jgi:hypothetical protein
MEQNPLTLVMTLKSPEDAAQLEAFLVEKAALPDDQNPIRIALNAIGTVHFARFTFLENKTKFAIITEYDGKFEKYLQDFAAKIGPVFDKVFSHMVGGPPAPVSQNVEAFMDYVRANDLGAVSFYSAYPDLTVLDIKQLAEEG